MDFVTAHWGLISTVALSLLSFALHRYGSAHSAALRAVTAMVDRSGAQPVKDLVAAYEPRMEAAAVAALHSAIEAGRSGAKPSGVLAAAIAGLVRPKAPK